MTGRARVNRVQDTYVCESCGKTFESPWSDEDAQAEALATFGPIPEDERAVICDDCYQQFMAWMAAR